MVKHLFKLFLIVPLFCVICFISGCNIDLLGLFAANDLDERLEHRNNYKFLDGKNSQGEDRNWRTTLTLGDSFQFIVLSDTHIQDGDAFGLEKLADVTKNNTEIKFVVITGDITQDAAVKDIDKFIEIADSLGVPCYPVAGNHDVYYRNDTINRDKGWPVWKEKIGSTNYRINGGGATLFILDSANSFFGKDQLDWLEREINTNTKNSRIFVFSHSPLFVIGPMDMQQMTDTKERARILSILRNKCKIMFMGHLHKHMENKAGNVDYLALASYIEDKAYYLVTVTPGGVRYERKTLK